MDPGSVSHTPTPPPIRAWLPSPARPGSHINLTASFSLLGVARKLRHIAVAPSFSFRLNLNLLLLRLLLLLRDHLRTHLGGWSLTHHQHNKVHFGFVILLSLLKMGSAYFEN